MLPETSLAFSPSFEHLAVVDGTRLLLYNTADGSLRWEAKSTDSRDSCIFSNNGAYVAFFGREALVFDVQTGVLKARAVFTDSATRGVFSPDSTLFAAGVWNGDVTLLDVGRGQVRFQTGYKDSIRSLAFSGDSALVATGGADGMIRVFDAQTGEQKLEPKQAGSVTGLGFDATKRLLITGSSDGNARVLELATGTEVSRLAHGADLLQTTFATDQPVVATLGRDRSARLFEALTAEELARIAVPGFPISLRYSSLGHLLVAGRDGLRIVRVDLVVLPHEGTIRKAAFSPDAKTVATADNKKTLRLFDASSGARKAEITTDGAIDSLAFDAQGKRLAIGGSMRTSYIVDATTGRGILTIPQLRSIDHIVFSPDGKQVGIKGAPWADAVFDAATGRLVQSRIRWPDLRHDWPDELPEPDPRDPKLPDWLASISNLNVPVRFVLGATPGAMKVVGYGSLSWLKTRPADAISSSPNREYLAIASQETVEIYALSSQSVITTIQFEAPVHALAFTADSRYLITLHGLSNGIIRREAIAIDQLAADACDLLRHAAPVDWNKRVPGATGLGSCRPDQ